MSKELLISLGFGVALLLVLAWGIIDQAIVRNPIFLLVGWVCVAGQIVTAHLAFNQYKNLSTQTPNEGEENDGEERSEDGFDD
jgi:hypothetical protein